MNNSENMNIRVIRYLFGIMGPIDEYKQEMIYKKAFNALIGILGYLLMSLMVMIIISYKFSWNMTFNIYLISNYVAFTAGLLYLNASFKHLKLGQVEVYNDQEFLYWKNFATRISLISSVLGLVFLMIFDFIIVILANTKLTSSSTIISLVSFFIFDLIIMCIGGFMTYRKLKKQIIRQDD